MVLKTRQNSPGKQVETSNGMSVHSRRASHAKCAEKRERLLWERSARGPPIPQPTDWLLSVTWVLACPIASVHQFSRGFSVLPFAFPFALRQECMMVFKHNSVRLATIWFFCDVDIKCELANFIFSRTLHCQGDVTCVLKNGLSRNSKLFCRIDKFHHGN